MGMKSSVNVDIVENVIQDGKPRDKLIAGFVA